MAGCEHSFIYHTHDVMLTISIEIEIQTREMAEIYDKVSDLKTAINGDVRIPGGDRRFNFIIAKDGSTEYGYKKLIWTQFLVNYRPYHRAGGVDYAIVVAPYFTRVYIEAESYYEDLYQL